MFTALYIQHNNTVYIVFVLPCTLPLLQHSIFLNEDQWRGSAQNDNDHHIRENAPLEGGKNCSHILQHQPWGGGC